MTGINWQPKRQSSPEDKTRKKGKGVGKGEQANKKSKVGGEEKRQ